MVKSNKRIDENIKYLLKKFMKHIFTEKYSKFKNSRKSFYDEYFKNLLKFEEFNKIFSKSSGTKFSINKINNKNLKMILQSKEFYRTIKNYCDNELNDIYKKEVTKKLYSLVLKWKNSVKGDGLAMLKIMTNLCDSIENNKKFKLPWTLIEVQTSVENFFNSKYVPVNSS